MNIRLLSTISILIFICLFTEGELFRVVGGEEYLSGKTPIKVRPPAAAGSFYPGSESQLRDMVSSMLNRAPEVRPKGEILAAIAPHAGYPYSGRIAALTFKSLKNVAMDTLVIIGHDSYRKGVAFTCPVEYFQTPLGRVPVDRGMIERMHEFNSGIKGDLSIHSREHSVEIQLPFIQVLDKRCKIVPILFGDPTPENCRILSDAIITSGRGKRVFVLASTDMSHYPPYDYANKIDHSTLEVLHSLDVNRLFTHLTKNRELRKIPDLQTAMCSRGGVGTAIFFAKDHGANLVQVLGYANSGDVPFGDKHGVVGYSSALIVKKETETRK
jgi:AmmeMemoRadiSam system protein B